MIEDQDRCTVSTIEFLGTEVDLAVVSDRANDTLDVLPIDPDTHTLTDDTAPTLSDPVGLPENIIIDGGVTMITDATGGRDTYTISPNLAANVTINDNDGAVVILPNGIEVTATLFSNTGVVFTVNGSTVTILTASNAEADEITYVFAGSPLDPTAGVSVDFEAMATFFGAESPDTLEGNETSEGIFTGRLTFDSLVSTAGAEASDFLIG